MAKNLVIDISHWDGDIDLHAWKKKWNLWGVIIKVGGRETGLGRYKDSNFERSYKKAVAEGLHIGAYYYTVTTDTTNAKTDAEHFASLLSGKNFDLPLYFDIEDARQFNLSRRVLTDVIVTMCSNLKSLGYYSGLYTGGSAWLNNMYNEELIKYADWIAWWTAQWPTRAGDIGMWQQGGMRLSDGHIVYADVSGYTDCDWCIVDYPSIIKNSSVDIPETKPIETTKINDKIVERSVAAKLGTADAVIKVAEGELGYYAPNDPLSGSKYGRWMAQKTGESWMAGPSKSIWWCCMFVSWVLNQAGVVVKGFPSQNTDVALNGGAKNYLVNDKTKIRRGDILIFDWNWSTAATDHIGFAKSAPVGGYVSTIEGNVSNSVQNKTRALSTIRYVVRPQYADSDQGHTVIYADNEPVAYISEPAESSVEPCNRLGGELRIDGEIGRYTILDWQTQLGTPADGEISGQIFKNYCFYPSLVDGAVSWDENGSTLIRTVQEFIDEHPEDDKEYQDGIWSYHTSKAIQTWLIDHGYSCGPSGADGWFGSDSAKALQRSLNDCKWK